MPVSPEHQKEQENSLFFAAIIHTGDDAGLEATVNSVLCQISAGTAIEIFVFYNINTRTKIYSPPGVIPVPFINDGDFFGKFMGTIVRSTADYCTVIYSGEELFEGAFDSAQKIFGNYGEVNWLTGIQTCQAKNGFNVILGNTAMRRWSYKVYERNLYKKSGRYIPPGSTFWRKSVWKQVSLQAHFINPETFCEDLWLVFFKLQKLYTCKIYFSTSRSYNKLDLLRTKQPNTYTPIEDGLLQRIMEFFFINNIPYLRLFYRVTGKLAPVIRFDHNSQSYFLSEY